ncbi:MAG TPA: UDP-2,3-diacylglucosamine diphosphatase [Candidatus Acidoferrales bacterium]|nr:UDP-2,3-diacylglucosamine diphosphatase [Candidatus Acidoferrales bacterium]
MKPVYFISDIHLGAPTLSQDFETKRRKEVLKFLDVVVGNGSRLIVVGDLFDFWFEYRYVVPKDYFWLYVKLKEMVDGGIAVDYVAGNHDFFLGEFFEKSIGLRVHQEGFSENINGKRFLIIHGDGLAQKDSGYRMLKKILRNNHSRTFIRWIHPDVGFYFAKAFSKKSREYTSSKDFGEADGMLMFAERKISEGYDFVIMGHNHVPRCEYFPRIPAPPAGHPNGKGVYVNLGDWLKNFTYGIFDGDTVKLMNWEVEA